MDFFLGKKSTENIFSADKAVGLFVDCHPVLWEMGACIVWSKILLVWFFSHLCSKKKLVRVPFRLPAAAPII